MSGYVEAGYSVALVSLTAYATSVVLREKAASRRLRGSAPQVAEPPVDPPK
ncbi:MAG TPA: hypothetical protein VGP46_13070 [Acidimicrobiales bacterium]|jgi:hypothetical protein|nr:hypothetical protein [Acidimicrobiales bacterium]